VIVCLQSQKFYSYRPLFIKIDINCRGCLFLYAVSFKGVIVSSNIPSIGMSTVQQSIVRKRLNSKQAHTAESKGKAKKGMTLVQIDKKSEFALNDMLAKRFCRLQKDYEWILNHRDNLTTEFPNKYIAVENGVVRFVGDTVEGLMSEISHNHEQVENFAIDFLSLHPQSFLF